ncbi:MAG TPA: 2Fe-2S iron-sulfur cluster-binding protein [Gammaproteobacteria bacterium]|nr:2Fe-2S iron-sulfur cluster-binding protein [Gammaproteobacteria bacterium]
MNRTSWLLADRKLLNVLVKPSGFLFEAKEDETILEAALRCGYFFPNLCRMGVCGTCRGKVLQGEIDYAGKEILALNQAERETGYALFCCARAKSDLVIEVKDFGKIPIFSTKEWIYNVIHRETLGKAITKIVLGPSEDSHLFYQAGQYIKIIHADGTLSPLSIASAPEENFLIELHLAHPPDNLQAQDILRFTASEKKVVFTGPYGNCTIGELYGTKPIIFLARGTGFAPVKAIVEEIQKFKNYPRMHFYWSVTSPDEFYMDELLTRWVSEIKNFSYTPVLSRDYPHWNGRVGLLQDVVLEDYSDLLDYLVYVSAPEAIVHDVLHKFLAAGVERKNYFSDVFDYF